jgi:TolB-like protein
MNLRIMLVIAFLVAFISGVFAESRPLAIADFAIHSDNPKYKYIGKGISEMIAVELRKSPGIELIEREKRTQILEEMEFALSDLTDSDKQLELGKLLAAGYIVFGEIIDMDRDVLISLRMIDVQSGKIVWNEKMTERLSKYDYISGYFAESILKYLDVEISRTTTRKTEKKAEKREEVVIALSKAIDHYDRQETEQAKKELAVAKRLDPKSEATEYYLAKLVTNTTKFKALTEPYYSYQNPAFLGILRTDSIHTSISFPVYPIVVADAIESINPIESINMIGFAGSKYISEMTANIFLGYAFPLGSRLGMRVDTVLCATLDRSGDYDSDLGSSNARTSFGSILDLGYSLDDRFSIGFGVGVFSRSKVDEGPVAPFLYSDKIVVSGNIGMLYRNQDESLIFDTRLGYNNDTYDVIDVDTLEVVEETLVPIFWENTLTLSFNERDTFFILKQINNICYDRIYYYGSLLPALEHFVAKWVSLRGGIEGSVSLLNDSFNFGYGLLGGVTFRNISRGFEIDLNITYRMRPSRAVEELLYPDFLFLFNLSWNEVFLSRQKDSADSLL